MVPRGVFQGLAAVTAAGIVAVFGVVPAVYPIVVTEVVSFFRVYERHPFLFVMSVMLSAGAAAVGYHMARSSGRNRVSSPPIGAVSVVLEPPRGK